MSEFSDLLAKGKIYWCSHRVPEPREALWHMIGKTLMCTTHNSGGSRADLGPISFVFMTFSAKLRKMIGWSTLYGVGTPTSGISWIRHCIKNKSESKIILPYPLIPPRGVPPPITQRIKVFSIDAFVFKFSQNPTYVIHHWRIQRGARDARPL